MAEERLNPVELSCFNISDDDVEALRMYLGQSGSRMQHLIQCPRRKKEIACGVAPKGISLYHQLKDKPVDSTVMSAPPGHRSKR